MNTESARGRRRRGDRSSGRPREGRRVAPLFFFSFVLVSATEQRVFLLMALRFSTPLCAQKRAMNHSLETGNICARYIQRSRAREWCCLRLYVVLSASNSDVYRCAMLTPDVPVPCSPSPATALPSIQFSLLIVRTDALYAQAGLLQRTVHARGERRFEVEQRRQRRHGVAREQQLAFVPALVFAFAFRRGRVCRSRLLLRGWRWG